ncbi:MAG: hypothetical protein ACYTHK_01570 [Planctomycetota bacterium]|jgi:hypothetical protein
MRAGLLAVLLLAACRAPDASYESEDGRKVRDIPALPYRVVLAVLDSDGELEQYTPDTRKKLSFTYTAHGVQKILAELLAARGEPFPREFGVHGIKRQNAFPEVRPALGRELRHALLQAQNERADLVIVPRLNGLPEFKSLGINGRWATSTVLWFTTWIFGLYVQDRRYLAEVNMDFDVVNPYDGSTLATYTTASGRMDATLMERNKGRFATDRTVFSLFLPAYLVPDNRKRTSMSLTARSCERIAAQLSKQLKADFARRAREITGTLQRVHPDPRDPVATDSMTFGASIVARAPITDVEVYVDGATEPFYELHGDSIAPPGEQAWGGVYRINFETGEFAFDEKGVTIQVAFAVQGRYASQTFSYRPPPPKPE